MLKKLISLMLVFIMAFSLGINAFATELVVLSKNYAADYAPKTPIQLVDAVGNAIVLYTTMQGVYYIALEDEPYENISVSANGIISAQLVEFDPETMEVYGMDIFYGVSFNGEIIADGLSYEEALIYAEELNNEYGVSDYSAVLLTNVNIIKITIGENFGTSYVTGTLKINAEIGGESFSSLMNIVLDVSIFEYEWVKEISAGYDEGKALVCGGVGYSDYFTAVGGYGDEYIPENLRTVEDAAVVSTTAFKAIEGQNIAYFCKDTGLYVDITNVAPGQKGVNFKHYEVEIDLNRDGYMDSLYFGFYGNQEIKSQFTVKLPTGYTWYTLREAFGIKIEEDDVVTYYLLKDGRVVKEYVVDYGKADLEEPVVLSHTGSNQSIGQYELTIKLPKRYAINYDANGGENEPEKQWKTEGINTYLSEDIPTRKWHTFVGWATSSDAAEAEYAPGEKYTADEEITLYAVWQENTAAESELLVSSGTASTGETVDISIDLSGEKAASMIQFAVKYDPNVLEVVSCGEGIAKDATVNYEEDGIIYFIWEDTELSLSGGNLLNIKFRVKKDAKEQYTPIEIVERTDIFEPIFMEYDLNEFRVAAKNGSVRVIEVCYGDVNGDGKVNVIDANFVRRYAAKLMDFDEKQLSAADVDGNGSVNVLDANIIRRYAAKIIDVFPVEG